MHILTSHTRSFLAIIETGSITAAADTLGLAKSSVSQNLQQLEKSLGVKLIHRTTRQMSPTPIGEEFYKRCKEIALLNEAAINIISEFRCNPSGPIKITAPHAAIPEKIAPAIACLLEKYPDLTPILVAEDNRLNLIESGIDVAITIGDLPDSDYRAQRIGTLRDILCVSPIFFKRSGFDPIDICDVERVSDWPYIAHSWQGNKIRHALLNTGKTQKSVLEFRPSLVANSVGAVCNLVLQGLGLALLPDFLISNDIAEGRLVSVLSEELNISAPIYAVHPYGEFPPLSVQVFIEEVRKKINLAN